jgi:hypothetical protein
LFDLRADPHERIDLAGLRPEVIGTLEDVMAVQRREALALYRTFGSEGDQGTVELGEKERERLEAFGYLQ